MSSNPVEYKLSEESLLPTEIEEKMRLDHERERADKERRLKLITFDWKDLQRIDWPYGKAHPKEFEDWKIWQADGRKLIVQCLHQENIYADSLLGGLRYPSDYLLESIARAEVLYPSVKSDPIILPPPLYWGRKDIMVDGVDKGYEWMTLPRVCCMAELLSTNPTLNHTELFSSAIVIWFQEHFGMPDDQVQAKLQSLDWETKAYHWSHSAIK
ncbi:MAG: hypothetical protein Q7U70_03465 [Methylotenera sp.]|nr:hypothetical protein [Methylotenera sp.]